MCCWLQTKTWTNLCWTMLPLVLICVAVFFLSYILYIYSTKWTWNSGSYYLDSNDCYYLIQLAGRPGSPESLRQLVEIARNPAALSDLTVGKEDNLRPSRDRKVTRSSNFYHCLGHESWFMIKIIISLLRIFSFLVSAASDWSLCSKPGRVQSFGLRWTRSSWISW